MNGKKFTALLLCAAMTVTPAAPAAAQTSAADVLKYTVQEEAPLPEEESAVSAAAQQEDGWKLVGKTKYYYQDGKKLTGLKKIGKYYYYFDKYGRLVVNKKYYKINGKYYKIDSRGVAKALILVESLAAARLDACGGSMRKAFNWSANLKYTGNVVVPKRTPGYYGIFGFQNHAGDCYVMAATFYWMAKVAGYDAHYVRGYFQKSNGTKGAHAWVEIDLKSGNRTRTYVYDPNFAKEYKLNGYKLTYGAKNTLKYVNYKRLN